MERLDITKRKMQKSKTESRCNMKSSRGKRSKLIMIDDFCDYNMKETIHMNFHNITHDDMLNGSGLRVVLWVSGCNHKCEGCQNPQTWDCKSGIPFDAEAKEELFEELGKDYISGVTFSGGDPLHRNNLQKVVELVEEIKTIFKDKTVWIYTGYKWEDVKYMTQLWKNVDVLVDGEFEKDKLDINYHWGGSTNQRVIDVQQTLANQHIILHE